MSNLIVVVMCKCENQNNELYDLLVPYQRKYAQRVEADYLIIHNDEKKFQINKLGRHISYNTFNVYDLMDRYDRIMKIDPDMLIKPTAPNVFKLFPDPKIHYSIKPNEESTGGGCSMMIMSNNKKYYNLDLLDKVQGRLFTITKPPIVNMGYSWNCFYGNNKKFRCEKDDANIIHYVGHVRLFNEKNPGVENIKLLNEFKVKSAKEDIARYC